MLRTELAHGGGCQTPPRFIGTLFGARTPLSLFRCFVVRNTQGRQEGRKSSIHKHVCFLSRCVRWTGVVCVVSQAASANGVKLRDWSSLLSSLFLGERARNTCIPFLLLPPSPANWLLWRNFVFFVRAACCLERGAACWRIVCACQVSSFPLSASLASVQGKEIVFFSAVCTITPAVSPVFVALCLPCAFFFYSPLQFCFLLFFAEQQ